MPRSAPSSAAVANLNLSCGQMDVWKNASEGVEPIAAGAGSQIESLSGCEEANLATVNGDPRIGEFHSLVPGDECFDERRHIPLGIEQGSKGDRSDLEVE